MYCVYLDLIFKMHMCFFSVSFLVLWIMQLEKKCSDILFSESLFLQERQDYHQSSLNKKTDSKTNVSF